jgi:quercetin dioxygenase-like cupin family protein
MAIPHANPGEIVDVRPLGAALATTITHTLIKTDDLEVIRIVLLAGSGLPPHRVPGEITVHCLEGKVEFQVDGFTREMTAGSLLFAAGNSEHSAHALENSSLLVTILLRHKG